MTILSFSHPEVVAVDLGTPVAEAAKLMESKNVGCVLVVQEGKAEGILTDRDIVLRLVNPGLDAKKIGVEEIMTSDVVTLNHRLDLHEALELVRKRPFRRYPVVDDSGRIRGLFSLDDVIQYLGAGLANVASVLKAESAYILA